MMKLRVLFSGWLFGMLAFSMGLGAAYLISLI